MFFVSSFFVCLCNMTKEQEAAERKNKKKSKIRSGTNIGNQFVTPVIKCGVFWLTSVRAV